MPQICLHEAVLTSRATSLSLLAIELWTPISLASKRLSASVETQLFPQVITDIPPAKQY